MLEAIALTKHYAGLPAVEDVSFSLRAGQVLGCLGPNGSGKSTTVKMLIGLLEPTRGQVLFRGEDIHRDLAAYRRLLGYVPEEANLYPYLTGWEYLDLVGTLRGMARPELERKSHEMLELLAMHPFRHAAIGGYSKGMRQRILLIAAILHGPEVLVLDEPLSGLDVISAQVIKSLIAAFGKRGKAVFYCSHVLEVVEKVCSHLLILRQGKTVAYDSMAGLQQTLGHESLERRFAHLVEETDTERIAQDLVEVMG